MPMRRFVLFCCVLGAASVAFADGMQIERGRFKGEVTVLTLTDDQMSLLKEKRILELTQGQRALLKNNADVSPGTLYIYFTKDGENDCTCLAWNLGLWFAANKIEVPHKYLVSEKRAAELQAELDAID